MGALNQLADEILVANAENGWNTERAFGDDIALLHSEVSEAYEEYRNGREPGQRYYSDPRGEYVQEGGLGGGVNRFGEPLKPEGIPSELADVLIRALDTAARYGIDMDAVVAEKLAYNKTRGFRHGGKVV